MKRLLIALAATLMLAACGAPPTERPTATSSPDASAFSPVPSPTAAGATATAPATQPPTTLLPAPLYLLELGQIARIERDGVTRRLLTEEQVEIEGVRPIADFALAETGELAYIVGDLDADRLVTTDAEGQSGRILYSEAGHELSDPLFAPGGERLLFRLLNNRQPVDLPSGIYSIPLEGGEPELLRADDEVDDPVNPARSVSGYQPLAFSPDGEQLLVRVQSSFYEDCTLGLMPATGGEVLRITVPEGQQVYCGEATWATDGASVLLLAGPDTGPELWRAETATGAAAPLLSGSFARAPWAIDDGSIRFFRVQLERDAGGAITAASFQPVALAPGASEATPLGEPFNELLERALWAPDGSGVVMELSSMERRSLLRWQPTTGEALKLPSSEDGIVRMLWGRA